MLMKRMPNVIVAFTGAGFWQGFALTNYRLVLWTTLFSLLPMLDASASIIPNYGDTRADVYIFHPGSDPEYPNVFDQKFDPSGSSVTATQDQLTSQVTSSFSTSGLSISITQSGEGKQGDYLVGYAVGGFHALSDMAYDFSGTVSSSGSEYTVMYGYLQDTVTGEYLFTNIQESIGSANFTLGLEEGNYYNSLAGSLTGFLQAGHNYYWSFFVRSDPTTGSPLLTTASAEFHFTESSAVPEPASSMLTGLGALGLVAGAIRRRRTSK